MIDPTANTTLPLDLVPLREGAEEMARTVLAVPDWPGLGDAGTDLTLWGDLLPQSQAKVVQHVACLLSDLTIDATRDRWVRWGIERDTAAYDAEAVKWSRVVADGYSEDVHDILSDGWARAKAADRRAIRERWHSLRDDPEALRAAILAALEAR